MSDSRPQKRVQVDLSAVEKAMPVNLLQVFANLSNQQHNRPYKRRSNELLHWSACIRKLKTIIELRRNTWREVWLASKTGLL